MEVFKEIKKINPSQVPEALMELSALSTLPGQASREVELEF